jgi:hypothetical protein
MNATTNAITAEATEAGPTPPLPLNTLILPFGFDGMLLILPKMTSAAQNTVTDTSCNLLWLQCSPARVLVAAARRASVEHAPPPNSQLDRNHHAPLQPIFEKSSFNC